MPQDVYHGVVLVDGLSGAKFGIPLQLFDMAQPMAQDVCPTSVWL